MNKDIHLNRIKNESWGFRLCGGIDLDQPLTIINVSGEIISFILDILFFSNQFQNIFQHMIQIKLLCDTGD